MQAGERALGPELFAEAVGSFWALLELNPGDNQGVRYTLSNWLLTTGDTDGMDRLLEQYPDEWSAQWAYTKTLHSFRRFGPGPRAEAALREALEVNPFVVAYLLGAKPLPKQLPAYIGMGDENEAVSYVATAAGVWVETPGALEWLAAAHENVMAARKPLKEKLRRLGLRR